MSVEHISPVEALLRELLRFSEVSINVQKSGHFFVAVKPDGCGPLWWYGCHERLQDALQECRAKAVELRLIAAEPEQEGG